MLGRRRALYAAAGAVILAAISSCGLVEGALGDDDAGPQVASVAVLVPGGTAGATVSAGVAEAVEAAVSEAVGEIAGWSVEVETVEEGDDAAATAEIAADVVDGDAVAVVGGLSTTTVRAVQPVFDRMSLLFVSPADVAPEHTRGADPAAPLRPYESYFRTAVPAGAGLEELARYAVAGLQADRVAVLDGGDTAAADQFVAAVRKLGAEVEVIGAAGKKNAAIRGFVGDARSAKADAVFVSGETEAAVALARQLRRSGLEVALLGGSAVNGADFIDAAGEAAEGATSVVPAELKASAGITVDAVPEGGPYTAAAHDAGTAIGTVLARCLPAASTPSSARKGCLAEMSELRFTGLTGDVAFDAFGDRVGGSPQLRVVRDGRWAPLTGKS